MYGLAGRFIPGAEIACICSADRYLDAVSAARAEARRMRSEDAFGYHAVHSGDDLR